MNRLGAKCALCCDSSSPSPAPPVRLASSSLQGYIMSSKQDAKNPQLEEENDRWGTLVVIGFLVGPPVLGILYSIFG